MCTRGRTRSMRSSTEVRQVRALTPLGPEKSRGFDIGLEQAFTASRVRARVGYFNNTFENLLEFLSRTQLVTAGVPPDVAASTDFGAFMKLGVVRCAGRPVVG